MKQAFSTLGLVLLSLLSSAVSHADLIPAKGISLCEINLTDKNTLLTTVSVTGVSGSPMNHFNAVVFTLFRDHRFQELLEFADIPDPSKFDEVPPVLQIKWLLFYFSRLGSKLFEERTVMIKLENQEEVIKLDLLIDRFWQLQLITFMPILPVYGDAYANALSWDKNGIGSDEEADAREVTLYQISFAKRHGRTFLISKENELPPVFNQIKELQSKYRALQVWNNGLGYWLWWLEKDF